MRFEVSAFPVCHCRPAGLLESCWTSVYTGSLKKVVLSVKECNCGSSRLDEFPERVRASKQRVMLFFFHVLLAGLLPADAATRRCCSQLGQVFPLKIIWLRNSPIGVPVNSTLSWFYILSSWQLGLAITGGGGGVHLDLVFFFSVWLHWINLFFTIDESL